MFICFEFRYFVTLPQLLIRKRSFVAVLKSGEQAARGVSCLQD